MTKRILSFILLASLISSQLFAQSNYKKFALGINAGISIAHADGELGDIGYHASLSAKYSLNNRFAIRISNATNAVNTIINTDVKNNVASSQIYNTDFQFIFNAVNFHSSKSNGNGIKPINANVYFGIGYGFHTEAISFSKNSSFTKNSNAGGYIALSFGYKKMISNVTDFLVEYSLRAMDNDYLEGFNPISNTNRANDYLSNVSIGFAFNLGKGNKNIEWTDVYEDLYQNIGDSKKKKSDKDEETKKIKAKLDSTNSKLELLDLLLTDTDNDGVNDYNDQEAESKTRMVDVHGVTLDTDKDGVPDYLDNCVLVAANTPNGCPQQKLVVSNELKLSLQKIVRGILFETGKATIKSESFEELNRLANILNENITARLTIEGHTDNLGDPEKNLTLSQQRADAVMKYLLEKGIDKTKIFAVGYGDTKPLVSNNTPKGRAKNRRVELMLY